MIVPAYWAEARRTRHEPKRQVTVRRFGWSEASQTDAQAMADRRADEALERKWQAGRSGAGLVPAREPKVPYNGAEGVPIREEIVDRQGETVLTRNSYGAVCLNTPNVLFVDIDHPSPNDASGTLFAVLLLCWLAAWWLTKASLWWVLTGYFAMLAALMLFVGHFRRTRIRSGWAEAKALERIRRFQAAHSEWRLRIYRTPLGLRVLALQRTFEPANPGISRIFDALRVDRAYRYMCERQRCFRARLTAKPWRIGITSHLRPRPGVWPVAADRLPARKAWLAEYDRRAANYSACRFLEELGDGPIDPAAAAVRDLHDAQTRAMSELPLA